MLLVLLKLRCELIGSWFVLILFFRILIVVVVFFFVSFVFLVVIILKVGILFFFWVLRFNNFVIFLVNNFWLSI